MTFNIGTHIKHVKRGTSYVIIGKGILDLSPEILSDGNEISSEAGAQLEMILNAPAGEIIGIQRSCTEAEEIIWVLYRSTHQDKDADHPSFWLRPENEFSDRFVKI